MERLDISAIEGAIQAKDPRGERSYAPRMMLALLVYGDYTGVFCEWALICTCHNIRKLWAARQADRL